MTMVSVSADTGSDRAGRDELALRWLKLVEKIANSFSVDRDNRVDRVDRDDLVGEGRLALVIACSTADPGVEEQRLKSYLADPIRWAMQCELRRFRRIGVRGGELATDRGERSGDTARRHEEEAAAKARVGRLLRALPPRERLVVRLVFGLDGDKPMQQNDLADELGLTHARIWKILSTALRRMELETHGIDPARCRYPGTRTDAPRCAPIGGQKR